MSNKNDHTLSGADITTIVSDGSGSASNHTTIVNDPSYYTTGTVYTQVSGAFQTLSKEEEQELKALKEEQEIALKKAKLNSFKELVPQIRQKIIDDICINKIEKTIKNTLLEEPSRLKELRYKQFRHLQWSTDFTINMKSETFAGLSIEELTEAHIEKTLEENMLNE